jgi:mannose-6-phosphate isomerase-like protein (cupin superfamily)
MANVIDISNAERYSWGDTCLGWHMVKRGDLSIIQEQVPSGKSEKLHYHKRGRQFFFILTGKAVIEIEGEKYPVHANQGISVEPGQTHTFMNESEQEVVFLVITVPKIPGDRVDIE